MRKFLLLIALGAGLLAACKPQATAETPTPIPAVRPTETQSPPTATAPPGETATATPAAAAATVTPRAEMEATDPATVVLASGQPQLIEFFAFW